MSSYTTTLSSTYILQVNVSADFGEIIITALLLVILALLALDFGYRLVYRA